MSDKFWEKPLTELNREEWEALCDGCGRCCLKKLADERTEKIYYTRVVCKYLVQDSCTCKAYGRRQKLVPECLVLDKDILGKLHWIPDTCAYRLRLDNKPLEAWHPLLTGSRIAMEAEGISVRGKVISEEYVHEHGLEEHIIRWVKSAC
ncbi:MAG: YcgN family cysteine cluster protein [Gammaproteobacteria bacterium]|nr:YcgN family cysteine cluster protein [Gammaproteobacteria bacterium]MDP2141121.1 YcgN family cysteine cluster protein [Gammaproteobacteria bacterium]MDP2349204.1 YcgN family cysteine cluster protein [Gammaproteobacteria bacterium]